MKKKVVVVGLGEVGKAVDLCLCNQGLCDELVLINRTEKKAHGYALDLMHSLEFMPRSISVYSGTYADCADAQVVIMCISGGTNSFHRTTLLESACKAVKPIVEGIRESGFKGIYLVLTNPCDTITSFIWRLSGLPRHHVIGSGTALDSARLRYYLGCALDLSPKYISAFVVGEHGDSQFVPWSCTSVFGTSFDKLIAENPSRFEDDFYNVTAEKVKSCAADIFYSVGSTSCGVASAAVAIVRAILQGENRVMTVSTCCRGRYGVKDDVFAGVPCVIGADGVRELIPLMLNEEEKQKFNHSIESIREMIELSRQFE